MDGGKEVWFVFPAHIMVIWQFSLLIDFPHNLDNPLAKSFAYWKI